MANQSGGNSDVFDIRRIRRLVEIMHENHLAEVDLQQGDMRIQLKSSIPQGPSPMQPVVAAPIAIPSLPTSPVESVSTPQPVDDSRFTFIKSPMVGTFYASPNPDSPPFVKVGDSFGPETTVCILESMKVFNEIAAECSGKIVAVLVKNGEPVEYGKPLFKIDPQG